MYENGWNRLNLLQWVDAAERAGKAWKRLDMAGMYENGWNCLNLLEWLGRAGNGQKWVEKA